MYLFVCGVHVHVCVCGVHVCDAMTAVTSWHVFLAAMRKEGQNDQNHEEMSTMAWNDRVCRPHAFFLADIDAIYLHES